METEVGGVVVGGGWNQAQIKSNWNWSSKGNKTVPGKVATTRTEDEHKTEYQNNHYNINQKNEGI